MWGLRLAQTTSHHSGCTVSWHNCSCADGICREAAQAYQMCGPPAACQQRFDCIEFGCLYHEAHKASCMRGSPRLMLWAGLL